MGTRMRTAAVYVFGVIVMSFLAACGGGGDAPPATKTGKFIDGPVAGVQYKGSHEGSTAGAERQGEFTYNVGSKVKFFVGNVTLGEANAGLVVTPLDLVPGSTEATPGVLNIVRFLMSVGTVDASNNISIPQDVVLAAKNVPAAKVPDLTEEQLAALVQAVKPGATLASTEAATTHLGVCLGKISQSFAGTYKGTMTPANWNWTTEMTVNADGTLSGNILDGGKAPDPFTGSIVGTKFTAEARGGCKMSGTVNTTTGTVIGTWIGPDGSSNTGGEFTMTKI